MPIKFPPPPFLTNTSPEYQRLNRWLLDIQSILNSSGGIDPDQVAGLAATTAQVVTNTGDITTLSGQIAAINTHLTTIDGEITTINGQITALNAAVVALQANPIVRRGTGAPAAGLGSVGDWYGDPAGAAGSRIWIKTAVGTWTAFPF